jgi:xylulokinase
MQAAGASLSWLRDQLARIEDHRSREAGVTVYKRLDELVDGVEAGSNGLYYLPYLMGERSPRWNPEARGAFVGLKMETSRAEIFRSVYEGVAFNLEIILKLVMGNLELKDIVMTGGGAKSRVWCQIFADIYNLSIKIPNHIEEATSIGAAVTAGVGLGVYDSFDAIDRFIRIVDEITPDPGNAGDYEKMKPVFDRIYEALTPVYGEMAGI